MYEHTPGEDHVTVTVNRSGAMNTVVSAKVKTTGTGSAQSGRDYSVVDTELFFPFGIDHLTVDIPVRTEYLTGEADFGLEIVPESACKAGDTAAAAVTMTGTYRDKDTLNLWQLSQAAPWLGNTGSGTPAQTNIANLETYKTLDPLNLKNPYSTAEMCYEFKGHNEYRDDKDEWFMQFKGDRGTNNNYGEVAAGWKLADNEYDAYYIAGAEVDWDRSHGCGSKSAPILVWFHGNIEWPAIKIYYDDYLDDNDPERDKAFYNTYCAYHSASDFSTETRYFYPPASTLSHGEFKAENPLHISFMNAGRCGNCSRLYIHHIKPILRPFQVNIVNQNSLRFLKEDGTRGIVTNATTEDADMKERGTTAVFFMNDSFEVKTATGTDINRCGYLRRLNLLDVNSKNYLATLAENTDPSNSSISYELNTENMEKLIKSIESNGASFSDLLRENKSAPHKDNGYATYATYNIQPEFDYLDAEVTLRNPYNFPVTFTICRHDYTVAANGTVNIKAPDGQSFHRGDFAIISDIKLGDESGGTDKPIGIHYNLVFDNGNKDHGDRYFADNPDGLYICSDKVGRINVASIIIEPSIQQSSNTIRVRVKTDELKNFVTEDVKETVLNEETGEEEETTVQVAGLLGQKGEVIGDYTYFTYADSSHTVNGRLYAIPAALKDSDNYVCSWYDPITMRNYLGNTFFFTADKATDRNTITLTMQKIGFRLNLEGDLKYSNYNLLSDASGSASSRPASGAIVTTGGVAGVADDNGYVMVRGIPAAYVPNTWLRYLVSVNGTDIVKEVQLTREQLVEPESEPEPEPDNNAPVMLWDFGADNSMSGNMGKNVKKNVSYTGETDDEGNDYYTFTAEGADPFVSIDDAWIQHANDLQWVVVRARNISLAKKIQIFAKKVTGEIDADSRVDIDLQPDPYWHYYVVNIAEANKKATNSKTTWWSANREILCLRLDPMETGSDGGAIKAGDSIQIDYVAFFDNKDAANAYRTRFADPYVLWDFNSDNAMDDRINARLNIQFKGERDSEGNDYYTISRVLTDKTPEFYISGGIKSGEGSEFKFVKIRAKSFGENSLSICPYYGKFYSPYGSRCNFIQDSEWHDYILPNNNYAKWSEGGFDRFELWIGSETTTPGEKVQIDYIAFFPTMGQAIGFRNHDNTDDSVPMVFDFNADNAMSERMGMNRKQDVSYTGETDGEGNDYYTFTAEGKDPIVTIDNTGYRRADTVQWAKIRARNLSGAVKMQLLGCLNGDVSLDSSVDIPLEQDTEWHEYLINIPEENKKSMKRTETYWSADKWLQYIRLDPMGDAKGAGMKAGNQIQIDYIALFPNEEQAIEFRSQNPETNVNPLIWDFGADNTDSANIGEKGKFYVTYTGETDRLGNDYFTFTATGPEPSVSLDGSAVDSVDKIRWAKIRARNLSDAQFMQLGAVFEGASSVDYKSRTDIPLEQDTQWHEYVINIPETNKKTLNRTTSIWESKAISCIHFIVMNKPGESSETCIQNGDQIQIDYIGFFPDEEAANAYIGTKKDVSGQMGELIIDDSLTVNISSNFADGVSPVTSAIFKDIAITGKMSNSAWQVTNSGIPLVQGESAKMRIAIKPREYNYSYVGENGRIISDTSTEVPMSVQFVVYDKNDVFRGVYEPVTTGEYDYSINSWVFESTLEFVEQGEPEPICGMDAHTHSKDCYNSDGSLTCKITEHMHETKCYPEEEQEVGFMPCEDDKLYLRLTTNRMAMTKDMNSDDVKTINEYQYTDIFTGKTFYQPAAERQPAVLGISNPIKFTFDNLPFVGSTGLNINFPFVNVGISKIHNGYRMYIGFSPVQISAAVMKDGHHAAVYAGSDGQYWKDIFSIKHPFQTFKDGLALADQKIGEIQQAAKAAKLNNKKFSKGSLGSPTWRFDIMIGVYFDFINPTTTIMKPNGDVISEETEYIFNGMGGYVSVTLGFKYEWYFILPAVFMPAYIGIEIEATVMGFLGADFNKSVQVSYDQSLNGTADINDGIDSLTGQVLGRGYVQLCGGVGLCGTLGLRLAGNVSVIANWQPTDPHGKYGLYFGISAGVIIDLFLFSIPLMYNFKGIPLGSFKYYADPEEWTVTPDNNPTDTKTLQLRSGSGEDSTWLGDQTMVMGAFRPNKLKEQLLAVDTYERPDAKLITLADGESLALAFIDSDNSKGETQRTTLKLATYHNGQWSQPVAIANDDTADFQPSVAETKDGNLLVAWVSTSNNSITDLSTDEKIMQYLNSMEIYAAFIELDENMQIKSKDDNGVTVADTEITRISNDHYTRANGTVSSYYDSKPTVVCDAESGDAMIYFIKSGRSALGDGDLGDYINPFTNDCVVCYMPFNAEAETDTDGREVPAGWLFNNFYYSEMHGSTANENMLVKNFGGQRFLDGPVNDKNERYTIPDFTAVSYNGLAVYSYTVDTDGSNDTDYDKEIYLQVYDFRNHETKHRLVLTDNNVADNMPQFFRSKVNGADEENAHTKLFWYRDGKGVVYIDVTDLLRYGINEDGTLKTGSDGEENDYGGTEGSGNSYTDPSVVYYYKENSQASLQSADFKAAEDSQGNLYILWTESVTGEDGSASQEIFGTGRVACKKDDGSYISTGWSKPYQITRSGYNNDEIAVAMSGDDLMVVHNRFCEELVEAPEGTEGQVDYMPIRITDMALVADTLEPCGSMEPVSISLTKPETVQTENAETEVTIDKSVTHPAAGDEISIAVEAENSGMNIAKGFKLSLYANDTLIGEEEVAETVLPNEKQTFTFNYTMPANVDGLVFKAVTQEMQDADSKTYYANTEEFSLEPLKAEAYYEISGFETYQTEDGFHAKFTATNTGNAASSDEALKIQISGPANLADQYTDGKDVIYSGSMDLGIGETKEFDVPVSITPDMMEEYGFVNCLVSVKKEVLAQTISGADYTTDEMLSNMEEISFDLTAPMNMRLENVDVEVGAAKNIALSMDLGEKFGSSNMTYAVDDLSIANIRGNQIVGVSTGYTTLYATHGPTGRTISAQIAVSSDGEVAHEHHMTLVPAKEATETEEGNNAYYVCDDCGKWFEDETGTKEITDHSSVVIPKIKPDDYFASLDELCEMSVKDYVIKHGVTPAKATAEKNEDGTVSIVLTDDESNELNTYTIDPTTGTGTDSEGKEVNLPQTGNTSPETMNIAVFAFLLILAGCVFLVYSGFIRRKKEDEAE